MLLRRFSVQGYKNLRAPIVLDSLGPINVIHGENNVGKSNVVQAIALFFRSLTSASNVLPLLSPLRFDISAVADFAPDGRELFHLDKPLPIVLGGLLDISSAELAAAGIQHAGTQLDVEVRLEWVGADATVQITRFRFEDGKDWTLLPNSKEEQDRAQTFFRFIPTNLAVREGPRERFAIIGVHRDLEVERDGQPLALEMYDSRESPDRVRRDRWRAFVRAMTEFRGVTGQGSFEITMPRSPTPTARLVFDTDTMRIPLRLLGTGVQQIAALLGHVLMRNASIAAIEEPELNLRWAMQERLREALANIVKPDEPGALNQLFITSHSAAFESGETFFLMEPGPDGPTVSRRPVSELALLLGGAPDHLGLPDRAPQAYVTSQGVVRLPDDVLDRLRIRGGGGVVFPRAEPHGVRMLSNEDFLHELGMSDEGEADAQR